MELTTADGYRQLLDQISDTYRQGQIQAVQAVNTQLIETYWQVGQHIVEFEQGGKARADYGHGEFVLPAYGVEILVEFLVIRR